jgi:hypothetical protein
MRTTMTESDDRDLSEVEAGLVRAIGAIAVLRDILHRAQLTGGVRVADGLLEDLAKLLAKQER